MFGFVWLPTGKYLHSTNTTSTASRSRSRLRWSWRGKCRFARPDPITCSQCSDSTREGTGYDICQRAQHNRNSFASSEQFGEGLRVERIVVEIIQHRVS